MSNGSSNVVIDTTSYPPELDRSGAVSHVRDLARLLSHPQPSTLGFLEFLGVINPLDSLGRISQFEFVFSVPFHLASPASLRTYLLRPSISLDAKFRLARCLARGVAAVHCADFVHKNIRPENILVLSEDVSPLPVSFLVGFERFRPTAAGTNLTGDNLWERNLCRHPTRQGIKPEHVYSCSATSTASVSVSWRLGCGHHLFYHLEKMHDRGICST